jgi:DNA-directed RNA polymerase specialized sigma24 family protein
MKNPTLDQYQYQIEQLYIEGLSVEDIAAALDCCADLIMQWLRDNALIAEYT